MRHADDGLVDALSAGLVEQRRQHRDQRFCAFDTETLVAQVLLGEKRFERRGAVQPAHDRRPLLIGEGFGVDLDAGLDPPLLMRILHLHVLITRRAGVRPLEAVEDFAKRHPASVGQVGNEEFAF